MAITGMLCEMLRIGYKEYLASRNLSIVVATRKPSAEPINSPSIDSINVYKLAYRIASPLIANRKITLLGAGKIYGLMIPRLQATSRQAIITKIKHKGASILSFECATHLSLRWHYPEQVKGSDRLPHLPLSAFFTHICAYFSSPVI